MGIGGVSMWQLLIILAIVIMLFGTKRLRNLGGDLGSAVKGFRKSMQDDTTDDKTTDAELTDAELTGTEPPDEAAASGHKDR